MITIENYQKYEDALEEIWALMNMGDLTPEQEERLIGLADAVRDFEKTYWGKDFELDN